MRLPAVSRRSLLVGGGVSVGLVVGYVLWPRDGRPALNVAPGEQALSHFVKVGTDGHVIVAVPQVELGNGVFTGLAQIVADELGADWRTVGVEVLASGLHAVNTVLKREWASDGDMTAATGGSSSVRAFEARLRDAGAVARALLCMAAAKRWDASWETCETHSGLVWHGDEKMRFGEVAAEAARLSVPSNVAWRADRGAHRLTGQPLPRLDLPSKVDGSVNFAADIRLPDMAYAAIAEGPVGEARVKSASKAAAMRVTGMLDLIETETFVAAVAVNSWAAQRGLDTADVRFEVQGKIAGDRATARALDAAFDGDGVRRVATGDVGEAFRGASVLTQSYRAAPATPAPLETASTTATWRGGKLEVWTATQLPGEAAAEAARAAEVGKTDVIVHPMMVGGSFGAREDAGVTGAAAMLAKRLSRPVQVTRARAAETRAQPVRAPAAARMAARVAPDGRIAAWYAQLATPLAPNRTDAASVDGLAPPYDIPNIAIDHYPADTGLPVGDWRGGAAVANAFFREAFIDEIAHTTGNDPFGARMGMLGSNPRLAQCLTRAAASGGWQGGVSGSNQGLAVHAMAGSFIAVVAQASLDGGRVRVERLVAVADVGRVVNPAIVRSQIIGGLVFGMSAATGAPLSVRRGVIGPGRLADLRLPRMADCPKIDVELIQSRKAPGGVGELAVPPVAPAIAGALFAATGTRYRQIPLLQA